MRSHIKTFLLIAFLLIVSNQVMAQKHIVINKSELVIYVINKNDTLFTAPVCVGKNFGDKQKSGDCRTPEGAFSISQIQDARSWQHDFGDGGGMRKGAYGPWFFRLKTPRWTSIGIHGTCFPESIGTRDSEGCVRLQNDDLTELRKHVAVGMKVIILPDKK